MERARLELPPLGTIERGEPATDEEIEVEELESKVQEDWVNEVKPLMDAGCCLYICEGKMERMIEARKTTTSKSSIKNETNENAALSLPIDCSS
jgi:hypothetical protein